MNVLPTTSQGLELQPVAASAKRPVKVLLVEADAMRAEAVLGHLAGTLRVRAEVTHATRLAEALAYLRGEQFHTILLDLDLPDGSPPEICEVVREHCGAAVIIVLAGSDDDPIALEALHRGADDYLVKARINADLLDRTIGYTLQRRRDIEEQVVAYQLLEQRVEDRTRELSTLLEVSTCVLSTLQLKPLISRILDQLKTLVDYTSATFFTFDGERFEGIDYRGPIPLEVVRQIPSPLKAAGHYMEVIRRAEPIIVGDLTGDDPLAIAFKEAAGETAHTHYSYIRSWMGVPLMVKDRAIGVLSMAYDEPDRYTQHDARMAMAMANQAAIAIENAKLYEEAQEAVRRTTALAQIASSVAFEGSLETILDDLARNVVQATGAEACAVLLLDEQANDTVYAGAYGLPEGYAAANQATRHSLPDIEPVSHRVLRLQEPVVRRDVRKWVLDTPEMEPLHGFMRDITWDTIIGVPLNYRGRPLGALCTFCRDDAGQVEDEIAFLTAIGDQAAVAVENARLFSEVQGKAALEERQRLARELHDSVSQAIFSISLHARTAEALLDRGDSARLDETIDHISSLAQAAMAEMRALIFELRPESLASEGLVAALTKQAAALRARHGIKVLTEFCLEPDLPIQAKEVLYRVAQEASHNTIKHARASTLSVKLDRDDGHITLEVADDGVGFDAGGHFPGHLGLQSMHERAVKLGGNLSIESAPGRGTTVRLRVPVG
ncbi:MAG TPA: GAF domain-containing protein [Chloroflexia bacterium]|jgi:signal transduction histidine kinase/DNA-binding response OmpR family regulator